MNMQNMFKGIAVLLVVHFTNGEEDICKTSCLCTTIKSKPGETMMKKEQAICNNLPKSVPLTVKSITVRGNLTYITKDMLSGFISVTSLNMSHCEISVIKEGAFSKLRILTILRLSNNHIQAIDPSVFGPVSQLEELYLNDNDLKVIDDNTFMNLTSLKVLYLGNNELFHVPSTLPHSLSVLDISNNLIKQMDLTVTKLRSLNLCGNQMLRAPEAIYKQSKLEELCLGNSLLYMSSSRLVWPSMTNLTISAQELTYTVLTHAMQYTIKQLTNLTDLKIENYYVDSLQFLSGLTRLRNLKLQQVNLTNRSTILFLNKVINNLSLLESLSFDSSPEVAKFLFNVSISFPKLQELSLRNTGIQTISDHNTLKILKGLHKIDLRENPLNCNPNNWKWVIQRPNNGKDFLIGPEEVTCQSPQKVKDKPFLKSITDLSRVSEPAPALEIQKVNIEPQTNNTSEVQSQDENLIHIMCITIGAFLSLSLVGLICINIYNFLDKKGNYRTSDPEQSTELPLEIINVVPGERFIDTKTLSY